MNETRRALAGLYLLVCADNLGASGPIEAVGLFKDRAMLRVQGVEHYLRVGETSPEGAKLVQSTAHEATVDFKGERYRVGLSNRVGANFNAVTRASIAIVPDDMGQYRVSGAINGQFVNYLVDTGASLIAISSAQAKGLGIPYTRTADVGSVVTAQGQAKAYFVTLDSVNVGGIESHNVKAAVIEGAYPVEILLGMSYLSTIAMHERNGVLTLEQKH
jgi:aspartyl protease family protein